ncbi:MAG: sigma-54 dependent transcriptional regulator [Bacteroidales bacterium]|nr:sigma-54 dependent transcriptional regulator [Bacteroidales bacterium]
MNVDFNTIKARFGMVGVNKDFEHAVKIALQVAKTDLSVLVTGESGTGKENIPKIIHAYSARKTKNYIAINCGAIPEGTIDSELFGHEKGSFTGAVDNRKGYFEMADGGTIFLDEVADLPLSTQVRLLRVLENGEFIKVGSSKVQKTDVRVVAATNVNIGERILKGKFREDLYYRLCSVPIRMPALRERKDDILALFAKFSNDYSDEYRSPVVILSEDAENELLRYSWPGNIRQLKNVAEQISLLAEHRNVNADDLKPFLTSPTSNLPVLVHTEPAADQDLFKIQTAQRINSLSNEIISLKEQLLKMQGEYAKAVSSPTSNSIPLSDNNAVSISRVDDHEIQTIPESKYSVVDDELKARPKSSRGSDKISDDIRSEKDEDSEIYEFVDQGGRSLEEIEKYAIMNALQRHCGNRKKTADELKISERTLYRKIELYNLQLDDE